MAKIHTHIWLSSERRLLWKTGDTEKNKKLPSNPNEKPTAKEEKGGFGKYILSPFEFITGKSRDKKTQAKSAEEQRKEGLDLALHNLDLRTKKEILSGKRGMLTMSESAKVNTDLVDKVFMQHRVESQEELEKYFEAGEYQFEVDIRLADLNGTPELLITHDIPNAPEKCWKVRDMFAFLKEHFKEDIPEDLKIELEIKDGVETVQSVYELLEGHKELATYVRILSFNPDVLQAAVQVADDKGFDKPYLTFTTRSMTSLGSMIPRTILQSTWTYEELQEAAKKRSITDPLSYVAGSIQKTVAGYVQPGSVIEVNPDQLLSKDPAKASDERYLLFSGVPPLDQLKAIGVDCVNMSWLTADAAMSRTIHDAGFDVAFYDVGNGDPRDADVLKDILNIETRFPPVTQLTSDVAYRVSEVLEGMEEDDESETLVAAVVGGEIHHQDQGEDESSVQLGNTSGEVVVEKPVWVTMDDTADAVAGMKSAFESADNKRTFLTKHADAVKSVLDRAEKQVFVREVQQELIAMKLAVSMEESRNPEGEKVAEFAKLRGNLEQLLEGEKSSDESGEEEEKKEDNKPGALDGFWKMLGFSGKKKSGGSLLAKAGGWLSTGLFGLSVMWKRVKGGVSYVQNTIAANSAPILTSLRPYAGPILSFFVGKHRLALVTEFDAVDRQVLLSGGQRLTELANLQRQSGKALEAYYMWLATEFIKKNKQTAIPFSRILAFARGESEGKEREEKNREVREKYPSVHTTLLYRGKKFTIDGERITVDGKNSWIFKDKTSGKIARVIEASVENNQLSLTWSVDGVGRLGLTGDDEERFEKIDPLGADDPLRFLMHTVTVQIGDFSHTYNIEAVPESVYEQEAAQKKEGPEVPDVPTVSAFIRGLPRGNLFEYTGKTFTVGKRSIRIEKAPNGKTGIRIDNKWVQPIVTDVKTGKSQALPIESIEHRKGADTIGVYAKGKQIPINAEKFRDILSGTYETTKPITYGAMELKISTSLEDDLL